MDVFGPVVDWTFGHVQTPFKVVILLWKQLSSWPMTLHWRGLFVMQLNSQWLVSEGLVYVGWD
jgi:hypothetical protein